jgi:hypothetical protein
MQESTSQEVLAPADVTAIVDLLVSAMEMLSSGLTALQETEREPDLDSVLQQLATGSERFLKVTLMEVTRNTTGRRPRWKEVRTLSHTLLAVLDALTAEARKVAEYTERPACRADLEFLDSEIGLRRLLDVLGHFGTRGRYSQIDGLLKGALDPDSDPKTRWRTIETDLLLARPDFERIQTSEIVQACSEEIVSRLQRMARAIARMWTLGAVGDEGGQFCGVVGTSLFLRDEDLAFAATR